MGEVFLVEDTLRDDRQMALKTIHGGHRRQLQKYFRHEFEALTMLRHPNLAEVYDFGMVEEKDTPFFTSEYVVGENLLRYGRERSFEDLAGVVVQVCRALEYIHSRGLIHHDIKPENVLVCEGDQPQVKLIDFGLVGRARTGTGSTVPGTIHYIAPEIFKGLQIDRRSDLYSLGILLYQITTGTLPYEGSTQLEVIRGHIEGGARPPRERNPALSEAMEDLILRLMAREAWERYPSANAVIERLNETLGASFSTETKATQESYILTGRFVGREKAYGILKRAFAEVAGGAATADHRFASPEAPVPGGEVPEADAAAGAERVLLITGEPGIGKKRLVKEFKTSVQLGGHRFLEGEGGGGGATPFGGFRSILEELVRTREGRALLPGYASELVKVVPEVAEQVEIEEAVPLKPEQERLRLIHAISRFLLEVSESRPYVMSLSDLQASDDITLDLLTYLARNLKPWPEDGDGGASGSGTLSGLYGDLEPQLLIVGTLQPSEERETSARGARLESLVGEGSVVSLKGLTEDQVASLIQSMLGMEHEPRELAQVVHRKTSGNPFFVEELMKSLVEEGILYRERGRWSAQGDSLDQIEIPSAVTGVIRRRLERLSGGEIDVLRAVSTFSGPAPASVLGQVREKDLDVLLKDLSGLSEKQILTIETLAGGERGYGFTHASMKEAVYGDMPLRSRRALHRRVGKAFEEAYGREAEAHLEEMARHFLHGRDRRRAFRYGVKAGEKAARMHANREALDFYLGAMDLAPKGSADAAIEEKIAGLHESLGELDASLERFSGLLEGKGGALTPDDRARIRRRMAEVFRKKGDFDQALKELRSGEEALGGDLDRPEGSKLLAFTGFMQLMKGAPNEALSPLTLALRLSRRGGDVAQEGAVYNFLGHYYYLGGRYERAFRCYEKSARLSEETGNLQGVGGALASLGNAYVPLGRYAEASEHHRKAFEIRKKTGDIHQLADSLNNLGSLAIEKGDFEQAEAYERECLRIRRRIGDDHGMGQCLLNLGIIYDNLERYREALEAFRKSLEIRERIGDPLGVANSLNNMGIIHQVLGEYTKAEACLKKSLFTATERGWVDKRLNALANLGGVYLSVGDQERAEEAMREGLSAARERGLTLMEGVFFMGLGDVYRIRRSWSEASRNLERAREIFQDLGNEDLLVDVDTARSRLRYEMGDAEGAKALARAALEAAEKQGLQKALTAALLALGRAETDLMEEEEAHRHLSRALKRAEGAGDAGNLWPIHHALGNLCRDTAKFDTAQSHYREAQQGIQSIAEGLKPQWKETYLSDRRRARLREDVEHLKSRMADTRFEIGYTHRATLKKRITDLENNHLRLLKLLDINKKLNSQHDLDALLDVIMDSVIEMCDAERGFLILSEDGTLAVKTARNINRDQIDSPEFSISHSIVRQTVQSGAPLILTNAQEDERFRQQQSVMNLNLRSVLSLPFKIKDRVLGAIYLDNRLHRGLFSDKDLFILEAFGDQAAIAIENTRLYRDNSVKAEKIEKLNAKLAERLERTTAELETTRESLEISKREFELKYDYANIIGRDSGMRDTLRLVDRIVDTNVPCLIQGESGTGKELIARAIHFNGNRKHNRFVSENCAAISESLLESELFGYEKGAFTGADRPKKGLFELAHKGTLFLDEISEMSIGMQAKLLRVLQENEIRRVGGLETIKIDVNIVSATNRDLKKRVEEDAFREDLYYRISTIFVVIPPLRERRQDIPLLVDHILTNLCEERNEPKKDLSKEVVNLLLDYDWPGNVRELENEVIRIVTLSDHVIKPDALSPRIRGDDDPTRLQSVVGKRSLKETLEEIEKKILVRELEKNHWNKSRTAKELGISRVALHKKLAKYEIS